MLTCCCAVVCLLLFRVCQLWVELHQVLVICSTHQGPMQGGEFSLLLRCRSTCETELPVVLLWGHTSEMYPITHVVGACCGRLWSLRLSTVVPVVTDLLHGCGCVSCCCAGRLVGDPPATAQMVGLMLCTAQSPVRAAASAPQAFAAAPAGTEAVPTTEPPAPAAKTATDAAVASSNMSEGQLSASAGSRAVLDSSAALHTAAFAALGLGPSLHTPLFTGLHAKIASSHALSVNQIAVQLEVDSCNMVPASAIACAAPAAGQEPAGATDAAAAAAAEPSDSAGTDAPGPSALPAPAASAPAEDEPSAVEAAGSSGAAALDPVAIRRSQRLAATDAGSRAGPLTLTTLQHLYAAVTAGAPVACFDDDEDDSGQYLAVWVCTKGTTPAHFTGEEGQVRNCSAPKLEGQTVFVVAWELLPEASRQRTVCACLCKSIVLNVDVHRLSGAVPMLSQLVRHKRPDNVAAAMCMRLSCRWLSVSCWRVS